MFCIGNYLYHYAKSDILFSDMQLDIEIFSLFDYLSLVDFICVDKFMFVLYWLGLFCS